MPYKYIGRTTDFKGKTLWEIVGNLKNYGIGRMVVRSRFERYPEVSYLRILEVEAMPCPVNETIDEMRKVKVMAERVFRGKKTFYPVSLLSASYKTDYRLVPVEEEEKYMKGFKEMSKTILPKYMDMPPLLGELYRRDFLQEGKAMDEIPQLKLVYRESVLNETKYRVAEEGETPTLEFVNGLGKPASPSLFKGIKL